ncbi:MAG: hypothetical protein V1929_07260 [bacterium]
MRIYTPETAPSSDTAVAARRLVRHGFSDGTIYLIPARDPRRPSSDGYNEHLPDL